MGCAEDFALVIRISDVDLCAVARNRRWSQRRLLLFFPRGNHPSLRYAGPTDLSAVKEKKPPKNDDYKDAKHCDLRASHFIFRENLFTTDKKISPEEHKD